MNPDLLKHFHNEWMHRHSHFWKILSFMLVVNTVITSFPVCCSYFGVDLSKYNVSPKLFPIIGIPFSVVCLGLLLAESNKLTYVRNMIIKQLAKEGIQSKGIKFKPLEFFINHFNYFVSFFLFAVMISFSIYMIIVL